MTSWYGLRAWQVHRRAMGELQSKLSWYIDNQRLIDEVGAEMAP